MSPSLESVCERLEAAIHAQNSAQSPAESALALLQLNAALTQALYQEPLAQPSLPSNLATDPASQTPEIGQAATALTNLLTPDRAAALSDIQALSARVLGGDASVTGDELHQQANLAAQLAVEIWPHLSDRPWPRVEQPLYRTIQEALPSDVVQLQREMQRQRQRTVELEQNSLRQSRALAAANNEVDRLRAILAGVNKQEHARPEWQQGLQSLLIGLTFIGIGLAAFFLARWTLNLPWPWLFIGFIIVLGLPVGLYAGVVYAVRGVRKLSPDRLLGYAAIFLILAFLATALVDRSSPRFGDRAGSVATRWVGGALRSPLTLIQAGLRAPAPFITALRGRSPAAEPTPLPTALAAAPTSAASAAPTDAAPLTPTLPPATVTLPPATLVITPTATLSATVSSTITVGSQVRVVNTQFLNARRSAGLRFQLATRFPADAILTVVQGPITADNYTWWEVKGEAGQGWCADQWLLLAP
ncbi:hypothetical protein [Candidatus Amarolinea aalborgensis]|jgi:hypothetical protein|uniref:hypothetical protein n=1 Tax=Candidatus Amarolinea aalborgensis TaxID=2249329 RepID=UPI003BF9DE68